MPRLAHIFCAIAALSASGCTWIGRQADALGEHMPVVGERCEHWHCMSEKGVAISDANKAAKGEPVPVRQPEPVKITPAYPQQPQ